MTLYRLAVAASLSALPLLVMAGCSSAASTAAPAKASPAKAVNGTYLALGDSLAFGYVPAEALPAPNYQIASSFVG